MDVAILGLLYWGLGLCEGREMRLELVVSRKVSGWAWHEACKLSKCGGFEIRKKTL